MVLMYHWGQHLTSAEQHMAPSRELSSGRTAAGRCYSWWQGGLGRNQRPFLRLVTLDEAIGFQMKEVNSPLSIRMDQQEISSILRELQEHAEP